MGIELELNFSIGTEILIELELNFSMWTRIGIGIQKKMELTPALASSNICLLN